MQPGLIYLIGPSGNPNFGDEFIAASWLKYLAVERPDADVWLDCPQPGLAQVLFIYHVASSLSAYLALRMRVRRWVNRKPMAAANKKPSSGSRVW